MTKTLEKPITSKAIRMVVKNIGDEFVPDRGWVPHNFRATSICLARANKVDDMSILNTTGQPDSGILNYNDTRSKLIANAVVFFGGWVDRY